MVYIATGIFVLFYSVVLFMCTKKRKLLKNGLNKRKFSFQLKSSNWFLGGGGRFCIGLVLLFF